VPDEAAQLLVEPVGLAPELVEWVLLGVAAQPDAAPHVVDLGQVLDPQRVDRPEQDEALDHRPVLFADLLRLRLELGVRHVEEVLADRVPTAQVPEVVLARPGLIAKAHRLDRGGETLHPPVVDALAAEVAVDEDPDLVLEEGLDRVAQVLVAEDLVAFLVDRLALAVDDVVVLDDALAHVEVEALDPARGAFDRLADDPRLDRDVVLEAQPLHEPGDAVRGEPLHEVVLERQVEPGRARVALAAGPAAELVVDPARVVALRAADVEAGPRADTSACR